MRQILRAKHWQIFSTFLAIAFLQNLFDIVPGLSTFLYLVNIFCYIGWLLLLGTWLRKINSGPTKNYFVFLLTGFLLIVGIAGIKIITVVSSNLIEALGHLQFLIAIYFLASLIFLAGFVGKNLKTIERGEQVDINDYFNDILSLIFWPIGIWMFQPRINKIERRLSGQELGTDEEHDDVNNLRPTSDKNATQRISQATINRLIGYGILVFVIGFVVGVNWVRWIQFLMPVGTIMTFLGVFYFFNKPNLLAEFTMNPKDDVLTYFWNVIVLKFWTFVFIVMMIVMNLRLISGGLL